jgi:hypothetical protein
MEIQGSDSLKSSETVSVDRRNNPRRRALKTGLIVYRGGNCTMGCRILDSSDTGASLMPADIMTCPKEFILKPSVGASRSCEVVWRQGEVIGVRYLRDDAAAEKGSDDKAVDRGDFLALRRDHEALLADFRQLRHTVNQLIAQHNSLAAN